VIAVRSSTERHNKTRSCTGAKRVYTHSAHLIAAREGDETSQKSAAPSESSCMHGSVYTYSLRNVSFGTVTDWDNRCERLSESVWLGAVAPTLLACTPCASVTAAVT